MRRIESLAILLIVSTTFSSFVVSAQENSSRVVEKGTVKTRVKDGQTAKKASSSAFQEWMTSTLRTYEDRLRPQFGVNPLLIRLGLILISISSISESRMEFTVEMFLHEIWRDERLLFNPDELGGSPVTLPLDAPGRIWTPDTTFLNALHSLAPKQGSVSHLHYMKLYSNGTIAYSRRLSVTAECPMDLTMYPFDQQICQLEISSYGWTVKDIIYDWDLAPGSIDLKNLLLPDFEPLSCKTTTFNRPYVAGNFSVAKLCIVLKRRLGFSFLQLFVPATAVVGSSWISLWLENETQFADMVAVILAIIFLSYSYNTVMPKVSYIKAMDIYLGACFIFAFLSLGKLAIVKYMHKRVTKRKQRQHHDIMMAATTLPAALTNALTHAGESEELEEAIKLIRLDNAVSHSTDQSPHKDKQYQDGHHDVYWKCMKAFHFISQLTLPLAFGAFGVFYFFIYPHVNKVPTCE